MSISRLPRFTLVWFAALLLLPISAFAQNDAQARKDLQALRAAYDADPTFSSDLELTIGYPNGETEVQKGSISQAGDRYRVEFDRQVMISDGKQLWVYLPDNNEVQLYDAANAASGAAMLRPQDLLTIYDSDDYAYTLVGERQEEGVLVREIEFKPLDRNSEYSKIRLTYRPTTSRVSSVQVFGKDGTRFTLSLRNFKQGRKFTDDIFVFRAADHPGVMVDDMRL